MEGPWLRSLKTPTRYSWYTAVAFQVSCLYYLYLNGLTAKIKHDVDWQLVEGNVISAWDEIKVLSFSPLLNFQAVFLNPTRDMLAHRQLKLTREERQRDTCSFIIISGIVLQTFDFIWMVCECSSSYADALWVNSSLHGNETILLWMVCFRAVGS